MTHPWILNELNQPHLLEGLRVETSVETSVETAKGKHIDDYDIRSTLASTTAAVTDDAIIADLTQQLQRADKAYPGGLVEYLSRAKVLLEQSAKGTNPFEGLDVSVPECAQVEVGTNEFYELENIGLREAESCCYVLVAGGLGERLGYPDIKIGLLTNMVTQMTYIEYYFECIKHLQKDKQAPVMIMTSGDTHEKTLALLKKHDYFCLDRTQVKIIQQEKVPALLNNDAHIAFSIDDRTKLRNIQLKPHGHGDVHTLIFQHGLARQWLQEKKMKWILFFQDTNAMTFKALPAFLAVSKQRNFTMNSLCIPRTPGEAVGAICKLTNRTTKEELTLNVEYNQLDALLKGMGQAGDVASASQPQSPFPGNCNILLMNLEHYAEVLDLSKGSVPEFVNPKYADASKTTFKSPTRVECMMQDFARLFDSKKHVVGATVLPRWFCFSTVKNCIADAATKMGKNLPGECALSAEAELYDSNVRLLKLAAQKTGTTLKIADPKTYTFHKMSQPIGVRLVFSPSYALTLTELVERLSKVKSVEIDHVETALVMEGDVSCTSLHVSRGALRLRAQPGQRVELGDVKAVSALGYDFEEVSLGDETPLMERVRGYRVRGGLTCV